MKSLYIKISLKIDEYFLFYSKLAMILTIILHLEEREFIRISINYYVCGI